MKDRQVVTQGTPQSLPIISPVLHWLAMPAIVFLRSSFGYSFLSPKSVFLVFSWSSFLFFVYTWLEPGAWEKYWGIAMFTGLASLLYVLHLALAFGRENLRRGKHDFYSGTSHLLRIPGLRPNRGNTRFERVLHVWAEPVTVFFVATVLRGFLNEHRLSSWLLVVAVALWIKEYLNFWGTVRSEKKHEDIIEDAEEKMQAGPGSGSPALPSAVGRRSRVKRPANSEPVKDEARHAEVLRMMPPYSVEQAETNFRTLMKQYHPDTGTMPNSEKAAELVEAVEHFRRLLEN